MKKIWVLILVLLHGPNWVFSGAFCYIGSTHYKHAISWTVSWVLLITIYTYTYMYVYFPPNIKFGNRNLWYFFFQWSIYMCKYRKYVWEAKLLLLLDCIQELNFSKHFHLFYYFPDVMKDFIYWINCIYYVM